ncbi:MAG TPA: DUF3488 and transglutaminase-like domain-containing protein [Candidatus Didemnitutus sp.]|nr:DUF3488 and transglutaminase-like domain-containing protein [Candidatus Didemnitutus sp.]
MSTARPQPQLSLDELRRLKWLLGGTVALVSLWTVFFLDVEALALVALASTAVITMMIWPRLPAQLPSFLWRLSVPAIVIAVALDFYFSRETLPVLIRLAVLLVLYRAVSYRRRREDLQLIVLGLFLIVVAGVLTVSLGFAFLLLLFTACTLGFLFVVTLIDAVDTGPTVMRPEEMREVPAWARGSWTKLFVRLRQVADWRLLALAAGLFVVVVGISAVLFLVIPRFELGAGFFLDKYITRKSRTGFSESVKFGDVGELIKDNTVAMRVDLTDAASIREAPYWRLVALDEYTPQGFKVSTSLKNKLLTTQRVAQVVAGRFARRHTAVGAGGNWTIYVEPGVSRYLPLPGSFSSMRLRDPAPLQLDPEINRDYDLPQAVQLVAFRAETMAMAAYQLEGVELGATLTDRLFGQQLKRARDGRGGRPTDRRYYDPTIMLRGPEGVTNEAALARMLREITGGRPMSAAEFARQATDWLRARHAYSLSVRIPRGDGDDIVRWLDSNEPGFCEYFAAGLTVLARAAGYPARVVAGFHGGTLNAFEKYYMVRNSDAHAWTEIYDGESAWLRTDATPGALAGPNAQAALAAAQEQDSSWSARFDSLRILWYRRIVNFDSRQQVQMIESVRTITTDWGASVRAWLEESSKTIKAWLTRPWDGPRLGRTGSWTAVALAAAWGLVLALRWGWRRWQTWRNPDSFDPIRQEAGAWLARLRKAEDGVRKTEDRGQSTEHGEVTADLQRLRYGRRETWPEPHAVFRLARRVRRAARG